MTRLYELVLPPVKGAQAGDFSKRYDGCVSVIERANITCVKHLDIARFSYILRIKFSTIINEEIFFLYNY